jgi:transposase
MSDNCTEFLPLRLTNVGSDGKRSIDKRGKQMLIEACLQPGVSVAGMALKAGVNANQLRRWIKKYKTECGSAAVADRPEAVPGAFIPVIAVADDMRSVTPEPPAPKSATLLAPVRHETVHESQRPPLPSRLVAQLPNGVSLET